MNVSRFLKQFIISSPFRTLTSDFLTVSLLSLGIFTLRFVLNSLFLAVLDSVLKYRYSL